MKFKARFYTEIVCGQLRVELTTFKAIITDTRSRAWELSKESAKRQSNEVELCRVLEIINPPEYKPRISFGFTIGDVLKHKKEREGY